MAIFRLKSGGGSSYLALIWAMALLLAGVYLLLTSLWPPSLLAPVWLALTMTGAFFVFRAAQHVKDLRSGNYPVALELGSDGFAVFYANDRAETHDYKEVSHGDGQAMQGMYLVMLQLKDGMRYHFNVTDIEFLVLADALEQVLGERFVVFEGARRVKKDMFK